MRFIAQNNDDGEGRVLSSAQYAIEHEHRIQAQEARVESYVLDHEVKCNAQNDCNKKPHVIRRKKFKIPPTHPDAR